MELEEKEITKSSSNFLLLQTNNYALIALLGTAVETRLAKAYIVAVALYI